MMPAQFKGVLLTLAAVLFSVVTGAIVKSLSADFSILSMLFYRFLFSLPILFGVAFWVRGRDFMKITQRRTMIVRVLFGLTGITFGFLSLKNIPLGQATALYQSSVLFVTLASAFFLGERVGIYRSFAVIFGLIGIVFLTDPFSQTISFAVLYALVSALAGAGLSITLRRLGKGDQPVTVAFIYNFVGFIAMGAMLIVMPSQFVLPDMAGLSLFVSLGIVSSLLQLSFTSAYRYSEAVVVATLRYLQLPLAGIVGFLLFTEVPTIYQIIGTIIVVSSCMFIIWREFTISRTHTQLKLAASGDLS